MKTSFKIALSALAFSTILSGSALADNAGDPLSDASNDWTPVKPERFVNGLLHNKNSGFSDGTATVAAHGSKNVVHIEQVGQNTSNNATVLIGNSKPGRLFFDNSAVAAPAFHTGPSDNNTVNVTQAGTNQGALINLKGDRNVVTTHQKGSDNSAVVQLGNSGNHATINQEGSNNMGSVQMSQGTIDATIEQAGTGNMAAIIGGEGINGLDAGASEMSKVLIDQKLANNSLAMVNLGDVNKPMGGNNNVSITQAGTAAANVAAAGVGNTITVTQGH